ncbi:hypothetical protein [Methylocystis parvus]|uniref:Uncharacterized protein n=1 Tax=Methylocystis parvus TaxID=134 RepID=A0A6B8M9D3_9HYPH|nr:hypothetical protein [Methylocystis parvus]QGM98189.1 hypothetical protein F7D14_12360 [Methylocystis parvus]WBK01486.1 hypothetical protein MMG94_07215 [Methylocystis parvus OBBP]
MTELGKFGIALASNEIVLSAAVTPMHRSLLASYRMNAHRGENSARDLIVRDLRSFLDLGALDRATDLLIVLALFTRETTRCERRLTFATRRQRDAIAFQRWRGAARAHYAVGKTRSADGPNGKTPNLRLVAPDGVCETIEDEECV